MQVDDDTLREWLLARPPTEDPLLAGDAMMTIQTWNDSGEYAD